MPPPITLVPEDFWRLQALDKQVRLSRLEAELVIARAEALKQHFLADLNERYAELDLRQHYTLDEASKTLLPTE